MFFRTLMTGLVLLLAPTGLVADSSETLAQFESHRIRPLVMPGDIRAFTVILGFDESQDELAELRYESYIDRLQVVADQSNERDKAIRERLDGILKGRYRPKSGEVKTLRVDLEKSKAENWPQADAEMDSFIEDVITLGSVVDSQTLDRARFEVYRRVYLRPARVDGQDSRYDGSGLDFFELVQEAKQAELQGVPAAAVDAPLDAWRVAMMPVIRVYADTERQAALSDRVAQLSGDTNGRINVMIERSKRWSARQSIDYTTFAAIHQVCPSAEAAGAWTARYRSANYPWLWTTGDDVERIADWILQNGSSEQQTTVIEVLPEYLVGRDELRTQAQSILYSGRAIGANLCDDIAPAYEAANEWLTKLMKNSGERTMLMRQARARMEQPLTDGQRAAIARLLLGR